ncbi:D-alanyl-D-alanine carboxypeptidase/D-alanyl-D-alanine-endopeptidase [Rhodoluna sp.]|uniref:D-alanyl-D-alanine carboxypeptidase/D-alanyl-D-alanine endopeptidase n=1 Tax=Rhodoluna sp. TaxID=1969481 RepID=UPI0025F69A1B|nr:D-alanyl-D-alanine carboxypeptidase/D-alanyl-D-alanine-endopeptidase [Rhodoluna sp.]
MSESNGRFGYWKDAAKGALIGAGVLALIIGGFSISGAGLPTNNGSNTPTATSSNSASPSPSSTSVRTCSVATQAADTKLGNLSAVVIDAKTNEVLFDRNASAPAATASTMKTLTAAAALLSLGPNYRVETRVYQDPTDPGTIILVGAGDPTLSRTAVGKQSIYRDAPKLSTLALNVNKKMGSTPITNIILDSTLFAGPTWESSWERSELTQGYMSEVTALQVDGDRLNPTAETSQRTTSPVQNAGKWFKQALGASAASATVTVGTMPSGATQLTSVSSQPVSKWITHMMQVSDNTEAEFLARLVSLDQGFDGSFSSINAAFKSALKPTNLDATGVVIKDGSGLSDFNAVSPNYMAQLYKLVYEAQGVFSTIKQTLPVSGESGSLASRFKGDNLDATGHIYAKTGWIKRGYTLAGIIEAKDGTSMVFAVYALGNVSDATKTAIDNLVTGFYRCGATLSNE